MRAHPSRHTETDVPLGQALSAAAAVQQPELDNLLDARE